tara:strand:+ start:3893 stop:4417 length:525 start_codon:yes stop_codon:yes gene_type:complete
MGDKKTMPAMNQDLERLAYDLAHADDEEREGLRAEVLAVIEAMPNKAEGYLRVIDRHRVEIEASKQYAASHATRAKRLEKNLEFLLTTLTETLRVQYDTQGVEEMRTSAGRWIRYYPEATKTVLVLDEEALSDDWFKETRVPRKADIRRALKEGTPVPGAVLEEEANPNIRWEK